MKTKILIFLSLIAFAGVISCNNDEKLNGLPKMPPFIQPLNIPALLFAGVPTDVSSTINQTEMNKISSVVFEVFEIGGTTPIKSGTINPTSADGVVVVTWNGADSQISTLSAGDYVLQVTVKNAYGSNVRTSKFTVPDYVIPAICQEAGKATILLLTREDTPATGVGLVGSLTGWGGSPDITMNQIKAGVYCAAVTLSASDQFKFRLNSSWGTQEKKDNCNDGDNRSSSTTTGVVVETVPKWGGVGC